MADPILEAALAYFNLGFPVVPVTKDKTPYIKWEQYQERWREQGQTEEDIRFMFDAPGVPRYGVALLMWPYSPLVGLDFDGPHARESWEQTGILLPATATHHTPSGGSHLLFSVPTDAAHLKRKVRLVHEGTSCGWKEGKQCGVDLICDGYLVSPPTPGYHEDLNHRLGRFAELPAEVVALLKPSKDGAIVSRLSDIPPRRTKKTTVIPGGSRNTVLTSVTGRLRRQGLTYKEILPAALAVNAERCQPPLEESEVAGIVQSVTRYAPAKEVGTMTEAEVGRALELLRSPTLLQQFLDAVEAQLCVGELENKLTLYLAMTSRKLPQPICLVVKGESSSGKNYLTTAVANFMPPEDVFSISAATPKALFYLQKSLSHKILIFAEAAGAEDADYSVRTMISEGELVILVPEKKDGGIITEERRVKGPVCFIQTTTKARLHPENETRVFDVHVDETEEQTKRIFEAQNRLYTVGRPPPGGLTVWQNAQRLLEPLPVRIPYISYLKLPTKNLRVRRDRLRFIALIEACAFLHQHQRERVEVEGRLHLVADLNDFEIAAKLASELLKTALSGLSPKGRALLAWAQTIEGSFSRKNVLKALRWSYITARRMLEDLCGGGWLEETARPGKETLYVVTDAPEGFDSLLPTREELAEQLAQLAQKA